MTREFDFPVYGTQGGGLARMLDGAFVWVKTPQVSAFNYMKEGDQIPEEWDLIPANEAARFEVDQREIDSMCAEQAPDLADFY